MPLLGVKKSLRCLVLNVHRPRRRREFLRLADWTEEA